MRNFGLRDTAHRFWHEGDPHQPEENWALAVIAATVAIVVLVGIFVA